MSSLIAKPYTKQDQEVVDTKVPDITEPNKEPNGEIETSSGTPSDGDSGTQQRSNTDWEKRYRDLQSYHDKQLNSVRQELLEAKQSKVSFSSPDEVEKFMKENPDLYRMMQTIAHEQGTAATAPLANKLENVEKTTKTVEQNSLKAQIVKAHPDFDKLVNSDEFHAWASNQSAEVKKWIYENPDNADLAIAALDLYKAKTGYKDDTKEKAPRAKASDTAADAVTTSRTPDVSGGKKIWKASEIQKLSPAQFEKFEEEIDLAWEEGRVDLNS